MYLGGHPTPKELWAGHVQHSARLPLLALQVASLAGLAAVGLPLVLLVMAAKDGRVVLEDVKFAPAEAWCRKVFWRIGACWLPTWRHRGAMAFLAFVAWWEASLLVQLLLYATAVVVAQQWVAPQPSKSPLEDETASSSCVCSSSNGSTGGPCIATGIWRKSLQRLKLALGLALGPSSGSLALAAFPLASPAIFLYQALVR